MTRHLFTVSLGFGLLILRASFAFAQQARNCAPRDVVLTILAERYGETRQSIGIGTDNQVMEVFASEESGSWTITVTLPNGMTCLMASGQSFEELTEGPLVPEGSAL